MSELSNDFSKPLIINNKFSIFGIRFISSTAVKA